MRGFEGFLRIILRAVFKVRKVRNRNRTEGEILVGRRNIGGRTGGSGFEVLGSRF